MARSLDDVVEELGVGWCQVRLCCFAGSIYHVGGEYMFLFGILPAAIALEWGLAPYQRAALGSIVFLGMLGGNLACFMNDSLGRRRPIIVSLLGMLAFAGCSAFAGGFWTVLLMWLLFGLAYGIGVPTWNALCVETTPSDWRWCVNSVSMAVFCLGSLRGALIVYHYAPDLVSVGKHWSTIMLYACAANAVLLALAVAPGFVESPRFLVNQKRHAEAREQLEAMKRQNKRPGVSLEFHEGDDDSTPSISTMHSSLKLVVSESYWPVTLVVGLTTFLLNFITFGQYYSLPQVLGSIDLGMSPALSIAVATCFEMAGYGLGAALEPFMGRKSLTTTYLAGACAFTVVFIWGLEVLKPSKDAGDALVSSGAAVSVASGVLLVHAGINGTRLFISVGWTAAYTYAGEVFPTLARAAGSGVCIACGRIGSLSAPWIYEHLQAKTGTHLWYFAGMGLACLVNAVLVLCVLPETKGARMDERNSEKVSTPLRPRRRVRRRASSSSASSTSSSSSTSTSTGSSSRSSSP